MTQIVRTKINEILPWRGGGVVSLPRAPLLSSTRLVVRTVRRTVTYIIIELAACINNSLFIHIHAHYFNHFLHLSIYVTFIFYVFCASSLHSLSLSNHIKKVYISFEKQRITNYKSVKLR